VIGCEPVKARSGIFATWGGDGGPALKEQDRIAQGFSPGNDSLLGLALKGRPNPLAIIPGVIQVVRTTPVLQHSVTPLASIRRQLVRRSRSSGLLPAEDRPRKRGALHKNGPAKAEGRVRRSR
jgi:hypothetical protein